MRPLSGPLKLSVSLTIRQLADEEKQVGIQGQWQQEPPAREYLEQVKCCHDTDCNEPMMKKDFTALWNVGRIFKNLQK